MNKPQKHPNLTKPRPLTEKEKRVIRNYKAVQDAVHTGPLYTAPTKRDPNAPAKTFGEAQFNSQYGSRGKADVDPFTSVETYSMKYDPPKRTLPDLSKIKFDKNMFPQELWSTIDGEEGEELKKHLGRVMEKKQAMMDGLKKAEQGKGDGAKSKEQRAKILSEKLDAVVLGEEEGDENEDEDREEELQDDDFEDDEDGGDYNAEQYFDDGAEDEDEGGDGAEEF
jgi:DNA-directed RNA polymerase III subunit RPC7